MLRLVNNIFGFRSRKKRRSIEYLEQCIRLTLALTLSVSLFVSGGGMAEDQLILIPFFSILILLHGIFVFLKCHSRNQSDSFKIHRLPFVFFPFLLWLVFSANFLSPVPWRAQMDLIVYFEAWIVLWIASNHILKLSHLRIVLGLMAIPFLIHLYLGYDQFFLGKNMTELGVPKKITGLFSDSTSFVFLVSLFCAVSLPLACLRHWKMAIRCMFGILAFLCFFALIFTHNHQGYWMLFIALVSGCFFAFYKQIRQWTVALSFIVIAGLTYAFLSNWVPSFADYAYSAFRFEGHSYGVSVFWASCLLFLNQAFWGVGLSAYGDQLLQIKSVAFPLRVEQPQNFYLLGLCELGLIGFLAWIVPLFSFLPRAWEQLKKTPKWLFVERNRQVPISRFYLSACGAFVISFGLASMFHSLVKLPFFLCLFALVLSIISFSQRQMTLSLQKSRQLGILFLALSILLSLFFALDGYRVYRSELSLQVATEKMEATLFTDAVFDDADLLELIEAVDLAIQSNRDNLDVQLLKSTLFNVRYNYNPIRYHGDLTAMLEVSQFVHDRQKNYWKAWMRHGISLALNGELESAEHALLRAVELAPQSFDVNFYMAFFCYQLIQDYGRAQTYLDTALKLQPHSREAKALSRKLSL